MKAEADTPNRAIQSELRLLVSQKILREEQRRQISERYPEKSWNLAVLARWYSILGALTAGAGIFVFIGRNLNHFLALEILFGLMSVSLLWFGRWIIQKKEMDKTGSAIQLLGCFSLTALTFTLGIHHSSGSGNWPALVGIDTVLFFILAYILCNRLIVLYAVVNLFVWFGGQTGYISGWGAYWLEMNYPMRYLIAGILFSAFGLWHTWTQNKHLRAFSHFGRVYTHFGLLIINLSLWLFSLFGYFGERPSWSDNTGQRLLFSLLWAAVSSGSIMFGIKKDHTIFRIHGIVFLLINIYTFYFQFIVAHSTSAWFAHLLLAGGSLIALAVYLERKLRSEKNKTAASRV
jgi:hypothetical protein